MDDQKLKESAREIKEGILSPEIINPNNLSSKVEAGVVGIETSGGTSEILSGMEGNEIREKDHSASEDPSSRSASSGDSKSPTEDEIRASLEMVSPPPTPRIMKVKVKAAISREIGELKKEVKKWESNAIKFAHKLAAAFEKLRSLKVLLTEMGSFAIEFLKMLYEKVVKRESLASIKF